ncbi:MAG TPA: hypothetical protein VGY56_12645 [Verrucomicrobiae bacterium]|nr:hypothetical protein [Verrucomicrobiae bacterium]
MKPAELYNLWAPKDSIWSNWAKPVLFADHAFDDLPLSSTADLPSLNVVWAPASDGSSAIVLDFPGAYAVWFGIALGQRGFRPVPLFNGVAGSRFGALALVDVSGIVSALHANVETLMTLPLRPDSPPAFLLDSNRQSGGFSPEPGRFDNRWCVFPQDFPSANFLLSKNIRSVVLAQEGFSVPKHDLAHILLRWQEAGIQILSCNQPGQDQPAPIQIEKPGNFRALWYRAMVLAGLRRNSTGGFGGIVPQPGSSGGYG